MDGTKLFLIEESFERVCHLQYYFHLWEETSLLKVLYIKGCGHSMLCISFSKTIL